MLVLLAYVIHGPSRVVIDGLRLACFILGFVLIGYLARYARSLWAYTTAVEWRGSVRDYQRRWIEQNKRLLGRILLAGATMFFMLSTLGTVAKQWGRDMGYWRLPANLLALALAAMATRLLIRWNNLRRD